MNSSVSGWLIILITAITGFYSLFYVIESDLGDLGIGEKIEGVFCEQAATESLARCEFSRDVNYRIYRVSDSSLNSKLNELEKILSVSSNSKFDQFNEASEHDAIRSMVLLHTVMNLEKYSHSEKYNSIPKVTKILSKYWRNYPEYVAASRCVDCGNHSDSIRELALNIKSKPEYVHRLALGSTRLLTMLDDYPVIKVGNLENHFKARAELSYSSRSNAISRYLIQQQDWVGLKAYVHNGPGAFALPNSDLDSIPREIIEQAWIESVSGGFDNLDVSQYLLQSGYRPALRWLVWYLAGDYEYFSHRKYNLKHNRSMLVSSTDFGHLHGAELAMYYSENWQNIKWDEKSNRWLTNK